MMKYATPVKMMAVFAAAGYCLVGISGCMSLMFPTIYGIALRGLGPE